MKPRAKRMATAAAVTAAIAPIPALIAQPASADICCSFDWATVASTLQSGSQSNEVGFWQAILYSNFICITNDGKFGTESYNDTKGWQQSLLGYTGGAVDGVVGFNTWRATEGATGPGGNRLQYDGSSHYHYYGGDASATELLWTGTGSAPWKYQQPGSGTWYSATSSLTVTSRKPC
jgi:hypothetical protein